MLCSWRCSAATCKLHPPPLAPSAAAHPPTLQLRTTMSRSGDRPTRLSMLTPRPSVRPLHKHGGQGGRQERRSVTTAGGISTSAHARQGAASEAAAAGQPCAAGALQPPPTPMAGPHLTRSSAHTMNSAASSGSNAPDDAACRSSHGGHNARHPPVCCCDAAHQARPTKRGSPRAQASSISLRTHQPNDQLQVHGRPQSVLPATHLLCPLHQADAAEEAGGRKLLRLGPRLGHNCQRGGSRAAVSVRLRGRTRPQTAPPGSTNCKRCRLPTSLTEAPHPRRLHQL